MTLPLHLKTYTIENETVQLFEPDKDAVMDSYNKGFISFPYWSQVWPAAVALARFLHCHPLYTREEKVLELAAGLGLPSIIAARNAASVITSDYVPEALKILHQSVAINNLKNIQIQLLDWNTLPDNLIADVVLLSDVSYDAALFTVQEKVIRNFLQQGSTVIISTPQRLIAKEAIEPLFSFCSHQDEMRILHSRIEVMITVMVLENNHAVSGKLC